MPREQIFRPGQGDEQLGRARGRTIAPPLLVSGGFVALALAIYAGMNSLIAQIDRDERAASIQPATEVAFSDTELEELRRNLDPEEFAAIEQLAQIRRNRAAQQRSATADSIRRSYVLIRNVGVPVCLALALVSLLGTIFRVSFSPGGQGRGIKTDLIISNTHSESFDALPPEMQARAQELLARAEREGDGVYTATTQRFTITENGETRVYNSLDEMPPDVRERIRKLM